MSVHAIGSAPVTIDGIDGYVLIELLPDHRVHLAWRSTRWERWPAGVWTRNTPPRSYWVATVRLPELQLPRFENHDELWLHVGTHAYTSGPPYAATVYLSPPPNSTPEGLTFDGHRWPIGTCDLADLTRKAPTP